MKPNSSEPGPEPERSRFFGRSKGKRLRDAQAAVFTDLMPKLLIPLGPEPLNLAALFPFTPQGYRLEIGFGGGEHLLKRAIENPEIGFIGCEPFVNGMAKLLMEIDRLKLVNIRVFNNDATLLLRRLPAASFDAIDLLYPDPWPKRRQRKRRFISDESLVLMAQAVKSGGLFRFASDIDDYVGWSLVRVLASRQWHWPAMNASAWITPYEGWVQTRYEAKAFREGRTPAYLTFVRGEA
ncbi:MAG: tRNA (guanine(46)-N(7))-methyltransferase TrmB [Beijerinckiaceae bacterium]